MIPSNVKIPSGGRGLPTRKWTFDGFNYGVDTFSLPTEVHKNALNSARNAEMYGRKSIRPRRGGEQLGADVGTDLPIDSLFVFQAEESSINKLITISGGDVLAYDDNSETWVELDAAAFTAGLRTRSTKLRGYTYLGNGTDPFSRFNGSIVETFTGVSAPTGLAVADQGTPGTTKYAYTVTAVTGKGESLPATVVEITDGNAVLDNSNYNQVTFNRSTDSEVIGYNIYGRVAQGTGVTMMLFIDQPSSGSTITFDDKGAIDPTIWLPPEGDSTSGISTKIWDQLRGSLIAGGDPTSVHRMYFSGTGEAYESFSPAQNGGWIDIRPGDNDRGIMGFAPFETKIIVFKENSIGQFYFSPTTGDPIYQELITYVGCGATGSIVVMENDIAFLDTERRMRVLGYEPNFTAAIRTTSLSEGRVDSLFKQIDFNYMENAEAVYFGGRYLLSVTTVGSTTNNKVIAYDRRYLSFLGTWDGADCCVRAWCVWSGLGKQKKLYAGSSVSDQVFEFGVEGVLDNYDGSVIITTIRTRNEDLKDPGQQKLWKWANYRLYRLQGTVRIKQIKNGQTTISSKTVSVRANAGWGNDQWNSIQWGVSTGVPYEASDEDVVYRKEIYDIAASMQHEVEKSDSITDFVLVSVDGEALMLPTEVFDSNNLI